MLYHAIPSELWAETILSMLDARDLMRLATVCDIDVPFGASFAPARALSRAELQWFAARGIPVQRLASVLYTFRNFQAWVVCDGNPTTDWWANRCFHRDDDLPAVEYYNSAGWGRRRVWYFHGVVHREGDFPAVEYANDEREWWYHGKRHRDGDRPAIEYANGDRKWYFHGELHRDGDLPAVVKPDGTREWWVHGERHREGDLPAIEGADGTRRWFIHGHELRSGLLAPFLPTHIGHDGSIVAWGVRWRSWGYWVGFQISAVVATIGMVGAATTVAMSQ